MAGVRRDGLAVVVRLPDDSGHVRPKVRVSVRLWRLLAADGGMVSVGAQRGVLVREAEVGGARAAGGSGRVHLLLGPRRGLDERRRRARGRLRQAGAERPLQLRDVISFLENTARA